MATDEGYIKFQVTLGPGPLPAAAEIAELDRVRTRVWELGWIGRYPDGTGFGNVSIRGNEGNFIISGTQTGGTRELEPGQYVRVIEVDVASNRVACTGTVPPSSESMSHAAIYSASPEVGCVLHIHHPQLWKIWMHKVPTTSQSVPYGTPAMASDVAALVARNPLEGVIVMAGHPEGLLAYAQVPGRALHLLTQLVSLGR